MFTKEKELELLCLMAASIYSAEPPNMVGKSFKYQSVVQDAVKIMEEVKRREVLMDKISKLEKSINQK